MSQYLIEQIAAKKNVRVEPYTEVMKAEGEDHLERIVTRTRTPEGEESTEMRDADALFVMIGAKASTAWLPQGLQRDAGGYLCTGRDLAMGAEGADAVSAGDESSGNLLRRGCAA